MVQSHLIPEQRADKNGVMVTRHVRPAAATGAGRALPPPAAPPTPAAPSPYAFDPDDRRTMSDAVLTRLGDLGWSEGLKLCVHKSLSYVGHQSFVELATMLPTLDERGASSVFGGIEHVSNSHAAAAYLELAIVVYPTAREIDDAVLPGNYSPGLVRRDRVFAFARDLFDRRGTNKAAFRYSDERAADLRAAYLLDRIGIDETNSATVGDYYRTLARIDREYDQLRPYLPLLIAAHTAYNGNGPDWYFDDRDYYFWEFVNDVKEFPLEAIVPIAKDALQRGEYEPGIAKQVADGIHGAITDGLL